jgi:hypothetical protein
MNQYDVHYKKSQNGNLNFVSRILSDLPRIQILNTMCNPKEVIMNIVHGKFTVLTSDGRPSIKHVCLNDCIDRQTPRGKKLLERIKKMTNRGWILQNERCFNENCILYFPGSESSKTTFVDNPIFFLWTLKNFSVFVFIFLLIFTFLL